MGYSLEIVVVNSMPKCRNKYKIQNLSWSILVELLLFTTITITLANTNSHHLNKFESDIPKWEEKKKILYYYILRKTAKNRTLTECD
jgi:hypothetical protein